MIITLHVVTKRCRCATVCANAKRADECNRKLKGRARRLRCSRELSLSNRWLRMWLDKRNNVEDRVRPTVESCGDPVACVAAPR